MSASDLHDSSAGAVAARRAHWASQSRRASVRRVPSGQGPAIARAASAAPGHVGRYARNPARYTRDNGVGGAVLTFFALMALTTLRRGSWPAQGEWMTIAGGTIVVVVLASLAPELVTHILLAVLAIMVITNASLFLKLIDWATGRAVAVAA